MSMGLLVNALEQMVRQNDRVIELLESVETRLESIERNLDASRTHSFALQVMGELNWAKDLRNR